MPTDVQVRPVSPDPVSSRVQIGQPVKIVIAGGFGVGKTTLIDAISEIDPVTTEHTMTNAGAATDDTSLVPDKTSTTVAMDFGRITVDDQLVLYLFGTPGQDRFWFMWDSICTGAIAAVVLADTRRLRDAFGPIDYFEKRRIPFLVAINLFDGQLTHSIDDVREALAVDPSVPIKVCDARTRDAVRDLLIALVQHAIRTSTPFTPARNGS